MKNDTFNTFTNRQDILALFQQLYEHNPKLTQELLPILLLQAPGGGGITTLINFLLKRSQSSLPHAYLDFAQNSTSAVIPGLLQSICDQIYRSDTSFARKFSFPRCRLGLSAILEPFPENNTVELRKAMEKKIIKSLPLHEHLNDLIQATANTLFLIALFFILIKWFLQILERSSVLRELLWTSTLKWYKNRCSQLSLPPASDMVDILVILRQWSRPTEARQRQILVERILVDAFLEDLREEFDRKRKKSARERTAHIVLFLDNFDHSLAGGVGQSFLTLLIKNRLEGLTDPLLVVLGTHQRLFDLTDPLQNPSFEPQENIASGQRDHGDSHTLYTLWKTRLLKDKHGLETRLCLPLWIHDFKPNESATYLLKAIGQGQLSTFEYAMLSESIQRITHGHPLALSLVAEVIQDARARGKNIEVHEIMREPVPSNALAAPNYGQKTVGAYLLTVLLHQFSEAEQEQFIMCSAPRFLDVPILKMILGLNTDKEAREQWTCYGKLNIVRIDEEQMIRLHPLVRDLLTQSLVSLSTPGKDYYKVIHSNLREYFAELAMTESDPEKYQKAQIEEAYHALALGDPDPTISYLCSLLSEKSSTWKTTLESLVQAPTARLTKNIRLRATQALFQAKVHRRQRDIVTALVLYSWFLNVPGISVSEREALLYDLSEIYRYFPDRDQQDKQKISHDYYAQAYELATQKTSLSIDLGSSTPITPFPVRKRSKLWRNVSLAISAILIGALLIPYFWLYYGSYSNTYCNPYGVFAPYNVIHSMYFSQETRIIHAPDSECIGMSDGAFAFDTTTNPQAGAYKMQASNALLQGEKDDATLLWSKALDEDPSDAEALIYLENQKVMKLVDSQHLPYVTLVALTMLTSPPQHQKSVATGRDNLRGIYLAQMEYNSTFQTPLLRIIIANAGDSSLYAVPVAEQIMKAAQEDKTIVGVIGPAQSRDETIEAVRMLGTAHIPIVSAAASSDTFTNISPYFFRASATNKDQVNLGIQFAEENLSAKTAVLFEDPQDNYSESLSGDFKERFQLQDHHTILATEVYNAGDIRNVSDTLIREIYNACTYNPDIIYFSGRADDMLTILKNLPFCGKDNRTKFLAADELEQIISGPGEMFPLTASNRVYYTSLASAYQWNRADGKRWYPTLFFENYCTVFGSKARCSNQDPVPEGHVMLVYDATKIFLQAIKRTIERTKTMMFFKREELRNSIANISGQNALQGVTGVIDFGRIPNGDPVDKVVVVLVVDKNGNTKLVRILGQLQLPNPLDP